MGFGDPTVPRTQPAEKLVPHARIRTCYLSLTRRVLIHISFCGFGTPGGTRTHKNRFLRPAPMPIRLPGHWWRTSESNRAGHRLAKAIRLPRAFPWCFVLESNQATLPCKGWLRTQRPKRGGSCGNRTRLNLLDRELPTQSVYEPQKLAGTLGLEPSAVRLTGGRHHPDGPMPIKVAGGFLAEMFGGIKVI